MKNALRLAQTRVESLRLGAGFALPGLQGQTLPLQLFSPPVPRAHEFEQAPPENMHFPLPLDLGGKGIYDLHNLPLVQLLLRRFRATLLGEPDLPRFGGCGGVVAVTFDFLTASRGLVLGQNVGLTLLCPFGEGLLIGRRPESFEGLLRTIQSGGQLLGGLLHAWQLYKFKKSKIVRCQMVSTKAGCPNLWLEGCHRSTIIIGCLINFIAMLHTLERPGPSPPGQDTNSKSGCKGSQPLLAREFPSINPEEDHFQKMYRSIVDLNRNYFTEKVSVGEVKKPGKYGLRLPSKTGVSEYHRRYGSSKRSMTLSGSVPQAGKSNMASSQTQVTNLQSSYRSDFPSTAGKLPVSTLKDLKDLKPKSIKIVQEKLPSFNQTAYNRDYQLKGLTFTEPIKPTESMGLGGRFIGESTYQHNYRTKDCVRTQPAEPIVHKGHKIFVGIDKDNHSSYQDNFHSKHIEVEPAFKPWQKRLPETMKLSRRSEYKNCYSGQAVEKAATFECLNSEQLDRYMMSFK